MLRMGWYGWTLRIAAIVFVALHRPEDDFDPPHWVSGRKEERS